MSRRRRELDRSAEALHASVEEWDLEDGVRGDPRDVVRRWSARDCEGLLRRLREALGSADIVLTFDAAHGTSLHPDHRAAALLIAAAVDGLPISSRVYALQNRANMTRRGRAIELAPAPAYQAGALVSKMESWPATMNVARIHRSQFDDEAIAALDATVPEARIVVATPVTLRDGLSCQ